MVKKNTGASWLRQGYEALPNPPKFPIGGGGMLLSGALGSMVYKSQGDSLGTSLMKGFAEEAAWMVAPIATSAYFGTMIGSALVQGGYQISRATQEKQTMARKVGPQFTYMDTNQALTMRQSAVQAIQGSKLNARNALGGEAAMMHKPFRG